MRTHFITTAVAAAFLVVAGPGIADHNSKNGEGTANMPNDIHNTMVETLESNDSQAFRDFVKYGKGSKTVNRFESEDTQPKQATERKGEAKAKKNQGESQAINRNKVETRTGNQDRSRIETRTRLQPRASTRSRPNRSATPMPERSGRKGGGRR
jgi:hypothetical protein